MMVVFFPITSLNFSCAVVFESEAGEWQTVQRTVESSSFPCSASHQ